ncbi:hypothetical protein [Pseudomonas coronafaciens]|uniref:Uncharacterized protein n=1 Tax=Pseudomonas coronafaciens pv. coronafaciens TaxID=235275 RepID=A0AAE6UN66_9PSED|nr:hypothetical protein [Pseudomonas coronafaciens]QGT82211.1 hypothetical protein GMO17_14010 [Pseudomonas coronafaciens pv. coronafaciens]
MAFLDVNKKMLAYLLTNGTHEDELRRFFRDSRAQLILRGARVQNLPRRNSDRIRAICDQLPPKTDETLRDWFIRNLSLSDPMPREDVKTYLQLRFDQSEDIQKADIKLIARSILIYLVDDMEDNELLALLQRPSGTHSITDNVPPIEQIDDMLQPVLDQGPGNDGYTGSTSAVVSYQLTDLLSAIIANDQTAIDEALTPFPFPTRALVDALVGIRCGDMESASKHLEALDEKCLEAEYIKKAMTRATTISGDGSIASGTQLLIPQPIADFPVSDSYDIVGICTNESETGAIFVKPLALRVDDKIYLLTRDDRVKLFPDSGDVMTHRSELRYQPRRRDLLHWRVLENEHATGKTRFRLESELEPLLEVYPVSVPSHDPDEIRERIKIVASTNQLSTNQQTVFALSDGIVLLSPKGVDITRNDAYEVAWQSLSAMDTWLIEGRQYCINPLKNSIFTLDLSTPESYLRHALKALEMEQKSSLSKTQKRELFELFRASLSSENKPRAERIISSVEQVSLKDEDVETILNLLNAKEEVRSRVQEMLDNGYASLKTEFSGLQAEIETLKQRKLHLKHEAREIERGNRESIEATSSLVKNVFSKSIQDGLATLANVEIFKALSGNSFSSGIETPLAILPAVPAIDTWRLNQSLSIPQALERIMMLGLNRRQAIVLVEVCSLSLRSGAIFILSGNRARQYLQLLARIDCQNAGVIDVPMGLSSGKLVREALDALPDVSSVVALNGDLSPVEIYAARIIDMFYEAAFDGNAPPKPFLISCLGSDMCLPLPKLLRHVSVHIDLNQPWDAGVRTLAEIDADSFSLMESLRQKIFEGLANVRPEYRSHVERALVAAISPAERPEDV